MVELFAKSGACAASDFGLHCLPVTRLRVSGLQWVNFFMTNIKHSLRRLCFVLRVTRKILIYNALL